MEYILRTRRTRRDKKISEKFAKCERFFEELCEELKDTHEVYICEKGKSASSYLVPKGTIDQITVYGKPDNSFRIADRWNWYMNMKKCHDEWLVQCLNTDLPFTADRNGGFGSSKGGRQVRAVQVGYKNGDAYTCVYGAKYDRKNKKWYWIEADPHEVALQIQRA